MSHYLQTYLGKNYKWWYIAIYNIKASTTYFWSDLFWYISQSFVVFVSIFIWSFNNEPNSREILNYLIFGNILFSMSVLNSQWRISQDIHDGKITATLLRPTNVLLFFFVNAVAYSIKQNFILLIYLIFVYIYKNQLDFNIESLPVILIFLILGLVIKFFYGFMFGASGFWFKDSVGLVQFSDNTMSILAGSYIPLYILNYKALNYTPFAFLIHHPMQIYLGKYSYSETILAIFGGLVWCLILWIITRFVFKLGLKKNEAVGL